jgi:membrane protease YdiL (CAAX protease family)
MGRWNVGIVWTLVAVLSPFALFFLSALALLPFGQPWPDFGQIAARFADSTWLVAWFLGSAVYGLGEEPGWRGFALPRLQKTYSVLVSALILAAFWGLWHAPFFLYRFQLGIGQVIGLFMGLFAGSIWLAFLYNMTRGSVLATMSWHVTWNMVNSIAMLVSTVLLSLLSAEIMIAAVVIALVWKSGRISPRKAPTDTQQNHEPVHHPLPALAR